MTTSQPDLYYGVRLTLLEWDLLEVLAAWTGGFHDDSPATAADLAEIVERCRLRVRWTCWWLASEGWVHRTVGPDGVTYRLAAMGRQLLEARWRDPEPFR